MTDDIVIQKALMSWQCDMEMRLRSVPPYARVTYLKELEEYIKLLVKREAVRQDDTRISARRYMGTEL